MNESRKSHKKSKRPHGTKPEKFHGKSKKEPFKHGKRVMKNSSIKTKGKLPQYIPEVSGRLPIEVQFAQKLAANEPTVRDRAVKKLKKWLMTR